MKKSQHVRSLVIFLSLCISSLTFAQGPGGGGPPSGGGGMQGPPSLPTNKQIKKMVAEIADEVDLTEVQEDSVLVKYQEHFEAMEEKISSSERPERSEMEALETAFQKEVEGFLTEEQIVKYEAYLKEQEEERGGQR